MVEVLPPEVARKIAAGEVIDRPYAVARELLDNAIDAGGDEIELYLLQGGISETRVVDNGTGMSKQDLELCFLPHATSKIERVEDLDSIRSLGFRGEALSGIAASSTLEIISKQRESDSAFRLKVTEGNRFDVEPCRGKNGTIVSSKEIFYSIPGRRRFLKNFNTEGRLGRTTFIEKALPFPNIHFKLIMDGEVKLTLPPSDVKERILQAFPDKFQSSFVKEASFTFPDFSIHVVIGMPELCRKDRRYMYTYVNNRRIQEFSLIQAVEYGMKDFLPGGYHPVSFVFIQVNPELVDFNIHPAKKEARFRNLQEIHHRLVSGVQSIFNTSAYGQIKKHISENRESFQPGIFPRKASFPYEEIREIHTPRFNSAADVSEKTPSFSADQIKYHGQIFSLFLLAERGNTLYIIDQHAAHERILYDAFTRTEKKRQTLLIPLEFSLEPEEQEVFVSRLDEYEHIGFTFDEIDPEKNLWCIRAVPEYCGTREMWVIDFIKEKEGAPGNIESALLASMACREAVKDGEILDSFTAKNLAREALELPQPRCPHGRPVWYEVTREELFLFVRRK